jgi:hypothetical protein
VDNFYLEICKVVVSLWGKKINKMENLTTTTMELQEVKIQFEKNLKKALRKTLLELKEYNHDWYGVIVAYDNGSVYSYVDAPGTWGKLNDFTFGDRENGVKLFEERLYHGTTNSKLTLEWFIGTFDRELIK